MAQVEWHGNIIKRWYWPGEVLNFDIDTVMNIECNIFGGLFIESTCGAQGTVF